MTKTLSLFHSLTLSLLLVSASSSATNYYVATTGSDSNSGTSTSEPFFTVTKAAEMVQAGDVVYIASGTYSEMNITPAASGSSTAGYIVFRPLTDDATVVFTKSDNTSDDVSYPIFNIASKSYVWIRGLQFKDMTYLKAALYMGGANHCVVTDCTFSSLGVEEQASYGGTATVWMSNATNCTVQNCSFSDIFGDGICLSETNGGNLCCNNSFTGMKGTPRSWSATGKYSSGIIMQGTTNALVNGYNLVCYNSFSGGQDAVWLDRGASSNALVRNYGNGGQRLIFNESRCTNNWVQENVVVNATQSGYRSALYGDTEASQSTRWIGNVAYGCPYGFYIDKSNGNEMKRNIVSGSTTYSMVYTQTAIDGGTNIFNGNAWYAPSLTSQIQYGGTAMNGSTFATTAGEVDGIYDTDPGTVDQVAPYYTLCGADATKHYTESMPYFSTVLTEVAEAGSVTVKVMLPKTSDSATTVYLTQMGGEATENTDYALSAHSVTIPAGETSADVTVTFIDNNTISKKLLLLGLTDASGNIAGTTPYTAFMIRQNEGTGISQVEKEEREKGTSSDVRNAEAGAVKKFFKDGHLIIVKDGKQYSVSGQQM